ncbi:hypothetical protein K438DRAFT_1786510 [Mycena galopus ATCC 62051]|nr:hypothetical protein K438DRAFT_1786510 [Mycena galopus ATCC 62051]
MCVRVGELKGGECRRIDILVESSGITEMRYIERDVDANFEQRVQQAACFRVRHWRQRADRSSLYSFFEVRQDNRGEKARNVKHVVTREEVVEFEWLLEDQQGMDCGPGGVEPTLFDSEKLLNSADIYPDSPRMEEEEGGGYITAVYGIDSSTQCARMPLVYRLVPNQGFKVRVWQGSFHSGLVIAGRMKRGLARMSFVWFEEDSEASRFWRVGYATARRQWYCVGWAQGEKAVSQFPRTDAGSGPGLSYEFGFEGDVEASRQIQTRMLDGRKEAEEKRRGFGFGF